MDAITPPKPHVLVEAQPFIPYVKEENFDPRLKPVLDPYKKRMDALEAICLKALEPQQQDHARSNLDARSAAQAQARRGRLRDQRLRLLHGA